MNISTAARRITDYKHGKKMRGMPNYKRTYNRIRRILKDEMVKGELDLIGEVLKCAVRLTSKDKPEAIKQ